MVEILEQNRSSVTTERTLHIAKVTPRVARLRRARLAREPHVLTWARFEAGLRQIYRSEPWRLKAIPKVFWLTQLGLWNKNYRGQDLHEDTVRAAEFVIKHPMGH